MQLIVSSGGLRLDRLLFGSAEHRYSVPETPAFRTPREARPERSLASHSRCGGRGVRHKGFPFDLEQSMIPPPPMYCRLSAFACVVVRGADAEDFLRRQLTQNPPGSGDARFALAAWNDAKGRVRALFLVARLEDELLLVAERDGLDAVLAKLRMFVLRSAVELVETDALAVAAVLGDAAALLTSRGVGALAERGAAWDTEGLLWLRLGPQLLRVIGPPGELDRLGERLETAAADRADLAEIRLGLPRLGSALAERYVPQMLNLDRLDAVAFDKGCYPGQEVVARLHHLGSVKRRLQRFIGGDPAAAPLLPGTPLVDARGAVVGEVLRAARSDGELELLAVAQLDAAAHTLFLAAEGGPPLRPGPLPGDSRS
jgi:tRNA-modifying protein YgfZ